MAIRHPSAGVSSPRRARGSRGVRQSRCFGWRATTTAGAVTCSATTSAWTITSARGSAELAGWKTVIEHGDGLREVEDRKYRRLRTVLRHPCIDLGLSPSPASGFRQSTRGGVIARKPHVSGARWWAWAARGRDGAARRGASVDLVIYGHSHVSALERSAARQRLRERRIVDDRSRRFSASTNAELR